MSCGVVVGISPSEDTLLTPVAATAVRSSAVAASAAQQQHSHHTHGHHRMMMMSDDQGVKHCAEWHLRSSLMSTAQN